MQKSASANNIAGPRMQQFSVTRWSSKTFAFSPKR